MSLINDMLRDLDARGAPAPVPGLVLPADRASKARRRSPLRLAMIALLLLALAAVLVLRPGPGKPVAVESVAVTADANPAIKEQPATPVTVSAQASPAALPSAAEPDATDDEAEHGTEQAPLPLAAAAAVPVTATEQPKSAAPEKVEPAAPVGAPAEPKPSRITQREIMPIAQNTSAAQQRDHQMQAAASALAQGREAEAEQLLREVLASDADAVRARLSLAALYQRQGREDAAISLWRSGLQRDASQSALAEPLARSLISRSEPAEAASVLAAAAPLLSQQPDYHALLAYAWQQAGQSARAAQSYRALLAHDDRQGRWWLGLATAEQTLGNAPAALTAFRRARDSANLENSVLRYVEQRIAALEATSP